MDDIRTEAELNDRTGDRVRPLPPTHPKRGRPFAADHARCEAILYLLRYGIRWRAIPACYPSGVMCWRRLRDWTAAGV